MDLSCAALAAIGSELLFAIDTDYRKLHMINPAIKWRNLVLKTSNTVVVCTGGEELGGENDQRCTCPVCNVTMANTFKLEKHMAVHAAPGKPLPKVRHLLVLHEPVPSCSSLSAPVTDQCASPVFQLRKCYHCARVFLESWQLDRHLEACHTHRCSRCDRVFSVQRDLDEHFVVAHAASGGKKKSTGKKVCVFVAYEACSGSVA